MSPPGPLVVAQVRSVWFHATETFLHTTVAGMRQTRALLLGQEHANADRFPVDAPVVALTPPGSLAAGWNRWRARLGGDLRAPLAGRRAEQALRRHGVGLLHAHFGQTGVYVLPLARRSGLPLVTTFYGQDASRLARDPVWRERYRELFETGVAFLAEGPHLADALAGLGCPREKIHVQPLPIVCSRYPFRTRRPRGPREPVRLLFCARFTEKKGLGLALEAVARVRSQHPSLRFRVAGDGPERSEVAATIARLGLGDCTELLGPLTHPQLIQELEAADLFIQPSLTAEDGDSEGGAPTTLLEAQACGLPVLATRHADIPFVVADGVSGVLAAERDVDGLAAGLRRLLEEPERWAALGTAGRLRVERFHDAGPTVARLEDLYLELTRHADAAPAGRRCPRAARGSEAAPRPAAAPSPLPGRVLAAPLRALARKTVPQSWRPKLRRVWWWGRRHHCPVCEAPVRHYLPEGFSWPVLRELDVVGGEHWPESTCPVCFVNTRSRLVWLYLSRESGVLLDRTRLLHIAPEPGILWRLTQARSVEYHPADLHPERYAFAQGVSRVDLTRIPYPDASFDVVLANHVLEHIPDETRALAEIRRILRPGGWAMLQVPLAHKLEHTLEDPAARTPQQRERRYGQDDHVRLYGLDYPARLERAGFRVDLYEAPAREASATSGWALNPRERLPIAWRAS